MTTTGKQSEYATFLQRVAASIIDTVVLFAISFIVGIVVAPLTYTFVGPEASVVCSYFIGLIVGWIFYACFESSSYMATPGKLALGIQVRDEYLQPVSFGRATGRHFARFISSVPLGVGYLFPLWTKRRQALHDIVARTVIVNK